MLSIACDLPEPMSCLGQWPIALHAHIYVHWYCMCESLLLHLARYSDLNGSHGCCKSDQTSKVLTIIGQTVLRFIFDHKMRCWPRAHTLSLIHSPAKSCCIWATPCYLESCLLPQRVLQKTTRRTELTPQQVRIVWQTLQWCDLQNSTASICQTHQHIGSHWALLPFRVQKKHKQQKVAFVWMLHRSFVSQPVLDTTAIPGSQIAHTTWTACFDL